MKTNTTKRYVVTAYGYEPPFPVFDSLDAAKKEITARLKVDADHCRKRYGTAKVSRDLDRIGGRVEFGCNLYSAYSACPA